MSFYTETPVHVLRDDEFYTIKVHGTLPENKVKLPKDIVVYLATGAYHKLEENKRITRFHNLRSYLVHNLITPQDSEERESNPVDIVIGKNKISIDDEFAEMSQMDIDEVDRITKTTSDTLVLEWADDRFTAVDKRLQDHPLFQEYKDMELIEEAYGPDADFPGHRIKELMDVMGGPLEFLDALRIAHEELPKIDPVKYADLSKKREAGIAVAIKAKNPELCPELAEGIVISVTEKKSEFRFPTPEEIAGLKKNGEYANLDLDYFEYPDGEKKSAVDLRYDLKNKYYDQQFPLAVIWNTFNQYFDVQKLAVPRALNPKIIIPNATLISNLKIDRKKLPQENKPIIKALPDRITTLMDLETDHATAQGLILQYPEAGRVKDRKNMNAEQKSLKDTARKAEILVRLTEAATQKGLYNPHYAGQPILLDSKTTKFLSPLISTLALGKAIHAKPDHILQNLGRINSNNITTKLLWDAETFTPVHEQPALPEYELISERDLKAVTGIEDFGYVVGMLGSASMASPNSWKSVHNVAYEVARHGMTQVNGGGTRFRTIMGGGLKGRFDAYKDGYRNAQILGIRTPTASRKEGNLSSFMKVAFEEAALKIEKGDLHSAYRRIGEVFHFWTLPTLAERQHVILGAGHSMVTGVGGFGTMYETFCVALDNVYMKRDMLKEIKPKTIFQGFHSNIRPIFIDNAQINGDPNKRFYNFLSEMFTPEELDDMGIKICNRGDEEIFDEMKKHAKSLGHDVTPPSLAL